MASNSVYDSSSPGSDLHFTFSTVQNGEKLDFTNRSFSFILYDSVEDLTGNPLEDYDKLIVFLNSAINVDDFILSEEDQAVSVIVPWSAVEAYEDGFAGDTYGTLEVDAVYATMAVDDYINRNQTFRDYTDSQKDAFKTAMQDAHDAAIVAREANEYVPDDECCEDMDPSSEVYEPPHDECFCSLRIVNDPCEKDPSSIGMVTWTPIAVTPAYVIDPYSTNTTPHDWPWLDEPREGCKAAVIFIDLYGLFSCEVGGARDVNTLFHAQAFPSNFGDKENPVPGWHDEPLGRQPRHWTTGMVDLKANVPKVTRMPLKISMPDIDKNTIYPQHEVLVTLDISAPIGANQYFGGTGGCYTKAEMQTCRCGCPRMDILDIPEDPRWAVPACINIGGGDDDPRIGIPNGVLDCEACEAECAASSSLDGVRECAPDPHVYPWPIIWPPYGNNQNLWKHHDVRDNNPGELFPHEHLAGGGWDSADPNFPSKYASWTADPYVQEGVGSSGDCFHDGQSEFFRCGGHYHFWLRFTDLQLLALSDWFEEEEA